jgi:hypothetical protein
MFVWREGDVDLFPRYIVRSQTSGGLAQFDLDHNKC